MASLIPGYEYDIFISYRQKDNKYDGWVTEFVDNLKKELEATFKEQVSLYFDINPSDYLLESYDVDASLKDKLKCLIFIPIISRTYCDSKSFAWVHEFKAFVEMASKDQYGLKVKLPNGNVANRVLPVRIHDLDTGDIRECESVLGGVLRGIEFIYKEAGIDKPLAPDDDEKKNLNNTKYRIQLIKVAHSIKEIILGMKNEPFIVIGEKKQLIDSVKEDKAEKIKEAKQKPGKISRVRFLIPLAIIALLVIAGIFAYPKIFMRNTVEKLRVSGERISVAVMPFQNTTIDTIWTFWETGIQDNLITSLSNAEELRVRQRESVASLLQSKGLTNYASLTPSVESTLAKKLDANVLISGSITKAGSVLRINSQLTDVKTKEILKSFQIEGVAVEDSMFKTIEILSKEVKNFLLVSKLGTDLEKGPYSKSWAGIAELGKTSSPDAYRYYMKAINALYYSDNKKAFNWISKSVSIDSTFLLANHLLMTLYVLRQKYDSAKIICNKNYRKRDQMTPVQQLSWDWANAWLNETPNEEIKYIRQALELDDQDPGVIRNMGDKYFELNQYENAIPQYEKALLIYKRWGMKPQVPWHYYRLGESYHKTGRYKKEKKLYAEAVKDFPYEVIIIQRQAILELTEGDTVAANPFIEKYISLRKTNKATDQAMITGIASIYSEAGLLQRAEKYYRQAFSLSPSNPGSMNSLAYFLIDKERNINEGLELIDKALEIYPYSYSYLHTKGWGLYKQGKYQEAKDILQESWDLRKKNAIYDHAAYVHLEEAKKAVEGKK